LGDNQYQLGAAVAWLAQAQLTLLLSSQVVMCVCSKGDGQGAHAAIAELVKDYVNHV
jgi:glutamate 5-kinase